ncbi:hypothetical protein [Dyadobacter luticola]|uniref:Uncharacterized protein n=1 Tax=Dyadobacter luticola TaxID=1979387 RepID=A0A5R9L4H6_9BACT|nr:hypothetical protein [Dyadobacter luticola]TLV03328.1 hypothetical protein FEN17_06870 [Dyadobacter luticola]
MTFLSVLAALLGCGSSSKKISEGKSASGPFEIRWEVYSSRSGAWFNNGGDFDARQLTSYFSVYYKGKIIEIPQKDKTTSFFWQALFLKDAPQPAVLVAMHSTYLIMEENGAPKITPVHLQDGDFASFQWIDSDKGQPGEIKTVYLGDHSKETRSLRGGRYLMVNKRMIVDARTLEIYPLAVNTSDRVHELDGYNAGSSGILQVSPGGNQLVLIGSRQKTENRLVMEYGLVVIEFKQNKSYVEPFDRTDFRLASVWDATPEWINTYFKWGVTPHEEILFKRTFDKLPPWHGWFVRDVFSNEINGYELKPVKKSMMAAFLGFLVQNYPITEIKREENTDFGTIHISLKVDGQRISFSHRMESKAINVGVGTGKINVAELGRKFNIELAKGKYFEHYDRFD